MNPLFILLFLTLWVTAGWSALLASCVINGSRPNRIGFWRCGAWGYLAVIYLLVFEVHISLKRKRLKEKS